MAIARANNDVAPSTTVLAPVELFPDADWATPHSIDPFTIPIEDKAALLLRVNEEALRVNNIRFSSSSILSVKEERLLATTEGSVIRLPRPRLAQEGIREPYKTHRETL